MTVPSAILFDLDDTLIDRALQNDAFTGFFQEHFASALAQEPFPPARAELARAIAEADLGGYRKRPEFAAMLQELLPWRQPPSADDLLEFWWKEFPRRAVATAGLYEVLQHLRAAGYRLGIITNGLVTSQSAKIGQLNLVDYVDEVVISGALEIHKPDPRIFYHALELLKTPAEQAWFVGDHPVNDVQGAEAAGLTAIWFQRNRPWPDELPAPRRTIDRLAQVIPMVEEQR